MSKFPLKSEYPSQGSYQFKFQYASYVFGWSSEELGYWLSVIGVMRAIHLIVVLPGALDALETASCD